MKRLEVVSAVALLGLAAFVGSEAVDARSGPEPRVQVVDGSAAGEFTDLAETLSDDPVELSAARLREKELDLGDLKLRLELASATTYIGEVLAAHDSSLARWPDRRGNPVRVWIQPFARIPHWSPTSLQLVRDAFTEWEGTGLPLSFTFVLDSASADVRVTWVDRFNEPISGKTLWTHDAQWWILEAGITLAVHHRNGEPLDSAAVRAIALHEVGHLVGLDHTTDSTSIMASRVRVKQISATDRATAQLLYAVPPGQVGAARASR